MIEGLLRWMNRRCRRVRFGALDTAIPVSRKFGLDRGLPIDRFYIEKYLQANRECIRGDVLEVAESVYTQRFGVAVSKALRIGAGLPGMEIGADLTSIERLPEAVCDCFIATQTFNFIYDVRTAINGACRLLRPGGVLIGSVSGISQVSRYDMDRWGDYWRFTPRSLQLLLEESFAGQVEIVPFGNVAACIAGLQGLCVEDLPDSRLLEQADPDYPMLLGFRAAKQAA